MFKNIKISAVISAFNEERFIERVIKTVLKCGFFDEIAVIDDGSTDKTPEILKKFQHEHLKIFRFGKNKGKSYAMIKGVKMTSGEIIVFLDADLVGLRKNHVEQLINPLITGEADITIGHPTESEFDKNLNPSQFIAGQRAVFRKDIMPIVKKLRTTKYGIETMLNLYYKSRNKKSKIVYLWNILHPIKFRKEKFPTSIKNYLLAGFHILKTIIVNYGLVLVVFRRLILKD